MKISISWKDLELDETGAYNEGRLADIRKQLRDSCSMEEVPELEFRLDRESAPPWVREQLPGFASNAALQGRFLEAAAHCARRLKNCGIRKWTLFYQREVPVPEAFTRRLTERLNPYFP
jgi:hypothetical protein